MDAELVARERVRLDAEAARTSGLRCVRIDNIPPAPELPRAIARHRSRYGGGELDLVAIAGKHAAIVQRTAFHDGALILITDGEAKRAKVRVYGACLTRDGSLAYAISRDERTVLRFDVATGTSTPVYVATSKLAEVALLGDRYLFAAGWDATQVVDLEAAEQGSSTTLPGISTWPRPAPSIGTVLDGRVVWLRHGNSRHTLFTAVVDGQLVRLGQLGIGLVIEERDDQVYGRTQFHAVRIEGIDDPVAEVKPARAARPAAVALHPTEDPVPFPAPPEAWRKKVKQPVTSWRIGAAGRFVGFAGESTAKLYWLDDAGRVRSHQPATVPRNFDADAGTTIAIALADQVTLVDANTVAARTLSCRGAPLVGIAFAADHRLAILAETELRLTDRRGRILHAVKGTKLRSVQALHDGRTLVVSGGGKHGLEVFSVARDKLVRRFRAPLDWKQCYAVGDRYFIEASTGAWYELDLASLAR